MTLDTRVFISGPIDGEAAFALALRAVLTAGGTLDRLNGAIIERTAEGRAPAWMYEKPAGKEVLARWESWQKSDSIATPPQGLPAATTCYYRADGSPLVPVSEPGGRPACAVEVSWDTAFRYRGPAGGCCDLHAAALIWLYDNLPEGCGFVWRNEFTGEDNVGLSGLGEFTQGSDYGGVLR